MKTGAGLALIAVGAILAFAVKGSPSWLNLHIAGWVIMIVGVAGLLLPRRTYGWLGRRMQVRQSYTGAAGGAGAAGGQLHARGIEAGRALRPTLLTDADGDPVPDPPQSARPVYRPVQGGTAQGSTEVIEDLYEQP